MAKKKTTKKKAAKKAEKKDAIPKELDDKLPPEVKKRLMAVKQNLDKFKKSIVGKFEKYITGIALLPPPKPKPGEELKKEDKDKLNIIVLVDDTEPHKMSKAELKDKLSAIIENTAKETDKNIIPETVLLSEVWQNCYDGKNDLVQLLAMAAPIHDTGMLAAIKISEVHKNMVMKKFEKYIVAYVLAGSLVQGRATPESDIDVFLIIDDTDVKKMTRAELKDKLRAIIVGMGMEAGELTGIKNKINIQVYILTDFWDSMREANPVIFTFLRDGVPFYDRGIFMPWKQLLKMGKIKPSPEAIDMYMSSGEQMLGRVKEKLKNIGTEDFFWSTFTPSQAALMLYGIPPPAPKETAELMRDVFVKKEKLLDEKDIKVLEKVLQVRKDAEHGVKKIISGKEIDDLVTSCDKYLKRLKKLFTQIEKIKQEEAVLHTYETIVTIVRDILTMEGEKKISEADIVKLFETACVDTAKIPAKYCRMLREVIKAKKSFDSGKLTKNEIEDLKKNARDLIKYLVEYMQRKRGRELQKAKIKIKHGEKYGEVTLLGNTAFLIKNLDAEERVMEKAKINSDGSLGPLQKSNIEEFEKALAEAKIPQRAFIKEPVFDSLRKIFGKDVEVLVQN
ncbi:nucleotidyltransferase domain-containing protein [Candidatus Woesearchaeota archaeon]|nr:nucleotidyltransferase domain-containing protein [Candidatus Woesearchaeota archaeon]MBW2994121.1 nucleotidyltransferase domain-containing protein [Candidatus Woesearchaeota archaeon]